MPLNGEVLQCMLCAHQVALVKPMGEGALLGTTSSEKRQVVTVAGSG